MSFFKYMRNCVCLGLFAAGCTIVHAKEFDERPVRFSLGNSQEAKEHIKTLQWKKHFSVGWMMGLVPTLGLTIRGYNKGHGMNYSFTYSTPFLPHVFSMAKASSHYIRYFNQRPKQAWYFGIGVAMTGVHINTKKLYLYDPEDDRVILSPQQLDEITENPGEYGRDWLIIREYKDRENERKRKHQQRYEIQHSELYVHPVEIVIGKEFFKSNGKSKFLELQITGPGFGVKYHRWDCMALILQYGKGF